MRDLRSYLQRPVLRVKSLLQACFDPKNNSGDTNSGYTVDLDTDFFNPDNPYYEDAWISLPLLNTEAEEEITASPSKTSFSGTTADSGVTGTSLIAASDGDLISNSSGVIDMSDFPFSYVNVSAQFGLSVTGVPSGEKAEMACAQNWSVALGLVRKIRACYGAVFVQLLAYNAETNALLGGSDIYCFKPNTVYANHLYDFNYLDFVGTGAGKFTPVYNAAYGEIEGQFQYDTVTGKHNFIGWIKDDNGTPVSATTWEIKIEKCQKANKMKFVLRAQKAWCAKGSDISGSGWDAMADSVCTFAYGNIYKTPIMIDYKGYGNLSLIAPASIATDSEISQTKLLATEYTPADYLLAYSKMFGLYWFKDQYENKIYCRTRNNFFYPVIENIDRLIDRSKEIETTPFTFEHKWYSMTQETPDTYFGKKYKTDWGKTFGDQKINTNYNFDSECEEMFEDLPYQNAIMARASSTYFNDYVDKNDNWVPSFFVDGWNGVLYNNDDELEVPYPNSLVDWSKIYPWYPVAGFDWNPKPCFYELDNLERKPVDIQNVLLFYNGKTTTPGHFWLTDDNYYMIGLGESVCWLFTEASTDEEGNNIATRLNTIPSFNRYKTAGGSIVKSWDFGEPKELYVDNISLGLNSDIYDQFWSDYLSDQFNVNSRVVTCYVLWDRIVKEELQRRFWYFDNAVWMLNRIIDYDLNGFSPTKCEFIKISDTSNYTKAQILPAKPNDGTTYDEPEQPNQPHIKPSSADPNNGYDPDSGSTCPYITFQDPLTEAYAVQAWDTNGDGRLDICEAAAVTSLGTVFKGTGIEYFDEIIYFTGINGIEAGAFSGCTNLQHIILPDNIDYIRDNAFKDCTGLDYIQVESTDPPVLGSGAFDNTDDCPIKIDCNYLYDFQTQWPAYSSRFECASGGGDTGETGSTLILATSITINVADITDSGRATYTLEPSNADNYNISWVSTSPNRATIDENGNITVLESGNVTICVRENVAGLTDCKSIYVTKTPTGYGYIEVIPSSRTVEYTSGSTAYNITTENIQ